MKIFSAAHSSFRKMKEGRDARKMVSQGKMNAIRTSLQTVEKEIRDMRKDAAAGGTSGGRYFGGYGGNAKGVMPRCKA